MNTTPELMFIQQELIDNPREHHRSIADRLNIKSKVVTMVCKDLSSNGKSCMHGTESKARAEHKRRSNAAKKAALARETNKSRNAAINISDDDWIIFKSMYKSAAQRLGEMIRKDIKSKGERNTEVG